MRHLSKKILSTIEEFKLQGKTQDGLTTLQMPFVTDEVFFIDINIPDPYFSQPAVEFEENYNVKGISQNYILPQGISADTLQSYMLINRFRTDIDQKEKIKNSNAVYKTITKLNPVLKKINDKIENNDQKYFLIMGVASAFNLDDIDTFIFRKSLKTPVDKMESSLEFKNLTATFNRYNKDEGAELELYWIAAPQTLKTIRKTLKNSLIQRNPSVI